MSKDLAIVNLRGRQNKQLKKGELYVGRECFYGGWKLPESPFHNPFKLGKDATDSVRQKTLQQFKTYLESQPKLMSMLTSPELDTVTTLCCWCKPASCHADILRQYILESRLNRHTVVS
jgi:hypothetical protein